MNAATSSGAQAACPAHTPNDALCRAHYRAAERIHAAAAWDAQVRAAAAAVSAEHVGHGLLVERAREIVYRGAFCIARREGRRVWLGASLEHDGGYRVLYAAANASAGGAA